MLHLNILLRKKSWVKRYQASKKDKRTGFFKINYKQESSPGANRTNQSQLGGGGGTQCQMWVPLSQPGVSGTQVPARGYRCPGVPPGQDL